MTKRVCTRITFCKEQRYCKYRKEEIKICIANDNKCDFIAEMVNIKKEDLDKADKMGGHTYA